MCKPGFAKLTVDYSHDQRSPRIALSAINIAFSVHSDHVQDVVVSRHVALALIACIVVPVFELLQSNIALKNLGPWVPGPRVPGPVFIVSPAGAV